MARLAQDSVHRAISAYASCAWDDEWNSVHCGDLYDWLGPHELFPALLWYIDNYTGNSPGNFWSEIVEHGIVRHRPSQRLFEQFRNGVLGARRVPDWNRILRGPAVPNFLPNLHVDASGMDDDATGTRTRLTTTTKQKRKRRPRNRGVRGYAYRRWDEARNTTYTFRVYEHEVASLQPLPRNVSLDSRDGAMLMHLRVPAAVEPAVHDFFEAMRSEPPGVLVDLLRRIPVDQVVLRAWLVSLAHRHCRTWKAGDVKRGKLSDSWEIMATWMAFPKAASRVGIAS